MSPAQTVYLPGDICISPVFQGAVEASVQLPGSKSITNRALLLAALATGDSTLEGVLLSDDTQAMLAALTALGVPWSLSASNDTVQVQGGAGRFPKTCAVLNACDAGTVTRFLMAACAAMPDGQYTFQASERMMARPIQPLLTCLRAQGTQIRCLRQPGRMPLVLQANGLSGGVVSVDLTQSSQFLSGLLMAAPYAKQSVLFCGTALNDKPYVQMTRKMMAAFGQHLVTEASGWSVPSGGYCARRYLIEPDASTASYFFALAALTQGRVLVTGLSRESLQGDLRFLEVLTQMGCQVSEMPTGICVVGPKQLRGISEINMRDFSDTFMTVAALAVFADAPTTLTGLAHTRLQESDRVQAMVDGLQRLGVRVNATEDTLSIYPSWPKTGKISAFRDHRIAMSFALIGTQVGGVEIEGASCVSKTCPDYFERLSRLAQGVTLS